MLTASSTSFSPSLVPPPALESGLRPSSALRALRLKTSGWSSSTAAVGYMITVYLPGSIARAWREATAFSIAIAEAAPESNLETSFTTRST